MPESQTDLAWDLVLDLGSPAGGALHERVERALRTAIREGRIRSGQVLPPSRALAGDLGCSRWAVTEAYGQLVAEGYLEARTGSGTRVSWTGGGPVDGPGHDIERDPAPRFDLRPGLPDLRAFPRRRWAEAVRSQSGTVAFTEFGFPDLNGHPRLRHLLAEYLRRARGVSTTGRDVVVCSGVTDGVRRLCRVLAEDGVTAVGCEEPGWTRLRQSVGATGMATVPIPVDEGGLRVDELARHPALRAVLVTPAHQFPTGTVLAPERRAALLRWAHDVDGVILEDDYDAEFRYDRRPVGTLQGLDPARVVLFGSLSKMMSPALGIGWAVAPPRWGRRLREIGPPSGPPPTLDQLAFAELLTSGGYERHLRRCRQRYRNRRDALVAALSRELPAATLSGIAAGLHVVLQLPGGPDAAAVVAAASARSVAVAALAGYYAVGDLAAPETALVLGYGNLADTGVDDAVEQLAAAIRAAG